MPKAKKKAKKRAVKRRPAIRKVAKARKAVKKAAGKRKKVVVTKKPRENVIGIVTHYFPHVQAAVIKLKKPLSVGETIKIKGHTTDLIQAITSMQIDRVPIDSAKKGQEIGLLVSSRVRQHDIVTKV